MSPLEPVTAVNSRNTSSMSISTQTNYILQRRNQPRWTKEIISVRTVIRKHLQPRTSKNNYSNIYPPAFRTEHLPRINILQKFIEVNQTQLKSAKYIYKEITVQVPTWCCEGPFGFSDHQFKDHCITDLLLPKLNGGPPVSNLLSICSSVFIHSSINMLANNRDNQMSDFILRKRAAEEENIELESLQTQERFQDNDKETYVCEVQHDQCDTPSKKIKVEDTTTQAEQETEHNTCSVTISNSNSKVKFNVVKEVSSFKGFCGLRNQGATCYLNAVLQTLFMTEDFRTAMMKLQVAKNKSVSAELQKLFKCLDSNKGSVTTKGITKALGIKNVCEQQDASEYFQKILSMTEPESKIFQGKKKHSTTCQQNSHQTFEEIDFFLLTIAMESDQNYEISVQNSLNEQFVDTLMEGEDQLFCERCNTLTDMKMSCTILELPQVLTLHMQRFYLDYSCMTYLKNNCGVKIPLKLLVKKGTCEHLYDLYAIVNHVGSLCGGHYYAEIKTPGNRWYEFNDSMVQQINNFYGRCSENHIISKQAYLLFFKKSNAQQTKDNKVMTSEQTESQNQNNRTNLKEKPEHVEISMPNDQLIEKDLLQESQDHKLETNEISSQEVTDTSTPIMKGQSIDGPHDNYSESNMYNSVTAEENKLSGIVQPEACKTGYNTKTIIDTQSEGDNQQTPSKISGITETTCLSTRSTDTSEEHTRRAKSWPKDFYIVTLQQKPEHVDISMSNDQLIEKDLQQESQDHKLETNEISSQEVTDTSTPVKKVQSIDGPHDNQSEPNTYDSVTAEENKLSGIVQPEACKTGYNTKTIIDMQSEGDNQQTPSKISGITETTCLSTRNTDTSEEHTRRAKSWPKDFYIVTLQQKPEHVDISMSNDQLTDRDLQQESQDHKLETNEISSQEVTDKSTPVKKVPSIDGPHDNHSEPNTYDSVTAEENKLSGIVQPEACKTGYNTKTIIDMQSEGDNQQTPSKISGITETTFLSTRNTDTSEEHTRRAKSWSKDFDISMSNDQLTDRDLQQVSQEHKLDTNKHPLHEVTDTSTPVMEEQSIDDNHDSQSEPDTDNNVAPERKSLMKQGGDFHENESDNEHGNVLKSKNKTVTNTQNVSTMSVFTDRYKCIYIFLGIIVMVVIITIVVVLWHQIW